MAVVREMYRLLMEDGLSVHGIAAHLNRQESRMASHGGLTTLSSRFFLTQNTQAATYSVEQRSEARHFVCSGAPL